MPAMKETFAVASEHPDLPTQISGDVHCVDCR
jgi:hypothetical protein